VFVRLERSGLSASVLQKWEVSLFEGVRSLMKENNLWSNKKRSFDVDASEKQNSTDCLVKHMGVTL
jgi:hypothetical protein